ncbi:hypothetical protein FSARC_7028 [Fusarium sarcochroum]|uniref:Uncharacterized protein n=1 Tax=Fusarium sarcochroum TaxID=1208366 RepID=A0A8H4X8T2_9HYPO|nr:hypothetical protein FSARC_7028 [Fusarium sarcochroum]
MLFSTFFFVSSLFLSANATFQLYDAQGKTDACSFALADKIVCDHRISRFFEGGWQGAIRSKIIMEMICTETCELSLQYWHQQVDETCSGKKEWGGQMWNGFNQTCDTDAKTEEYCNDIIGDFPQTPKGEELPKKYLCEPCYARRLFMVDLSKTGPDKDKFADQRERVRKECPELITGPHLFPYREALRANHSEASSGAASATESADQTTASSTITTSSETTSSDSDTSSEPNAAGKLERGP